MTPPPFDPDNPHPPGRFQIRSACLLNGPAETETFTANCTIHGEIYRIVFPSFMVKGTREIMNTLRPALFKDHIARFHA